MRIRGKATLKSRGEAKLLDKNIKSYEELVYKFSPIFVQSFNSKYDIPTIFDLNVDFIGNIAGKMLKNLNFLLTFIAMLKESEIFLIFYYLLFYPRDYLEDCENLPAVESCHQKDWEQVEVVIKKQR